MCTPPSGVSNKNQHGKHGFIGTVLLLLLGYSSLLSAAQYALLVGVSDYFQNPLAGPVNDVSVMNRVLQNKWKFKENNIDILLNEQGTKKNILSAIDNLYKKSKPGDQIFIYLSGHGTSAGDHDLDIPLPTTSGAFIPYDIAGVQTMGELIKRLIIGRKDFRPLLTKLDEGNRSVFVAIDACYSGNTVRGSFKKSKLQKRFMSVSELLPRSAFANNTSLDQKDNRSTATVESDQGYPYKNIYYLSASSEYEPAQDIPPEMVAEYPTIDGKPHGAFSDTLLRILNNNINSDTDNDGAISYSELKQTLRNEMSSRGFEHTPQGLPTLIEDRNNLAKKSLFGMTGNLPRVNKDTSNNIIVKASAHTTGQPVIKVNAENIFHINPGGKLKLSIDPALADLVRQVKQTGYATLVDTNADMEIRSLKSEVLFISKAGDLVATLVNPDIKTVMYNIAHQAWIHQIINQPYSQQFNVDIEMSGKGRGSTAIEGELIGFSIKSTEDAYILLLDIDSQGTIHVIYPYTAEELKPLKANKTLLLDEISRVSAPFGRDNIQVYAVKESTPEYDALRGKSFTLGSPDALNLERLINAENITKARAGMELITIKKD